MGAADYCLIVAALFFGLLAFSIHREEQRRRERRKGGQTIPAFVDRRVITERRDHSITIYAAWALRSQLAKLKNWF
jgi:hypothetical protein